MDGWKTSFLLGWFPGRCYVSFREDLNVLKFLHVFHLHLPEGSLFSSHFLGFRWSHGPQGPQGPISSRPNRPSNGPHCLRTGTTTFGGPISHEPLPQEIVALENVVGMMLCG